MSMIFDGKKIRDEMLDDLKIIIDGMKEKPILAVVMVGDNPVSLRYVELKRKIADRIGIKTRIYHYPSDAAEGEVVVKIKELNRDAGIDGIMVQIPVPEQIDRSKVIEAIDVDKDIDGLHYCLGLWGQSPSRGGDSPQVGFLPPVVLAIEEAMRQANQKGMTNHRHRPRRGPALAGNKRINEYYLNKEIVIVGGGFLVGDPLYRHLNSSRLATSNSVVVVRSTDVDIIEKIKNADIVISATGQAGIIKLDMVKEGVILIDAGTSEVGGELKGDIDPACYQKSSFYTPVPGGIGPVTVAMLMRNLVNHSQSK